MADYYTDRVVEGSATTGTGTLTLDGVAPALYRTFATAAVPTSSVVVFLTVLGADWEISRGTFTSPSTLTRTLLSSSTGSLINWGSGTKTVSLLLSASGIAQFAKTDDLPTLKIVTDTTDISLADIATTYTNFGSSFVATIPTEGLIGLMPTLRLQADSAAICRMVLGIRIATTNYWPRFSENGTITYATSVQTSSTSGQYREGFGLNGSATGGERAGLDIVKNAIPTGSQTIQLVVARSDANTGTIKGTAVTSRAMIEIIGAT